MKYKAVIFDLDGTLLDTLEDLADSMNSVLERLGFPTHEVDKYKYFVGKGMENLAAVVLPDDSRDDATVRQCFEGMRREYDRRWAEKTHPYKGINELLACLKAMNMKMCVLSNKPDDFTGIMVKKFFPGWSFEVVYGARPSVPKKPDPFAALEIARLLSIPASEFLYIGDTNTDMQTANAAGMYAVGALWGFRTADELMESGAQLLVEKPTDLLDFL